MVVVAAAAAAAVVVVVLLLLLLLAAVVAVVVVVLLLLAAAVAAAAVAAVAVAVSVASRRRSYRSTTESAHRLEASISLLRFRHSEPTARTFALPRQIMPKSKAKEAETHTSTRIRGTGKGLACGQTGPYSVARNDAEGELAPPRQLASHPTASGGAHRAALAYWMPANRHTVLPMASPTSLPTMSPHDVCTTACEEAAMMMSCFGSVADLWAGESHTRKGALRSSA